MIGKLAPLPLALLLAASAVHAQAPPQFDAATIKLMVRGPGDGRMKGGPGTSSPGRVTWQLVWLGTLLERAFDLDPPNLTAPAWMMHNGAQLYSLTAVMPPDTSKHDFQLMLQSFLIEQFKIKLHHQLKMFPSYDLVVARGGAKLKAAADPDAPDDPPVLWASAIKEDADGFPILPKGLSDLETLGNGDPATFQNFTMEHFARRLGSWLGNRGRRTYVTDKTGLTGKYDFRFAFDPNQNWVVVGPGVQAAAAAQSLSAPPNGLPNIFKALERQLGLRLIKGKDVPRETIVVDSAERIPVGDN